MVRFKICLILSVRGKDYIKLNDFSFKDKNKFYSFIFLHLEIHISEFCIPLCCVCLFFYS